MISVPDLYRFVRGWNSTADVPNVNGTYKRREAIHCDGLGICELFRSVIKQRILVHDGYLSIMNEAN